jgi:hypothetical protein
MTDTAPGVKPEDRGNDTLDTALGYLGARLSIIPIALDGTKHPDVRLLPREYDEDTSHFKATWNPFKDRVRNGERVPGRLPTEKEVREWFDRPKPPGIAVIGGAVSGGLECLDFDTRAEEIFPTWCEMVEAEAPGLLAKLSIARTPKPGYHVRYRCIEVSIPGNTKLAEDPALPPKERTLIETRGEGGYALAPGCPAECHETGRLYEHQSGPSLTQVQTITAEEREVLIRCARSFDLKPVDEQEVRGGETLKGKATAGTSPGDDYNCRGQDWTDILTPHGWTLAATIGRERRWRRPDKSTGWSATTGVCFSKTRRWELLKVFSSNAAPFEPGSNYSKFAAYTLLHHNGDFSMAARTLAAKGFGTSTRATSNGQPRATVGSVGRRYTPIPPYRSFPVEDLPPILSEYVPAAAAAIGCDPALVAVPALAVAAGCIGNARAVVLKRGWNEPSVIWGMTVAESGDHKTPGYEAATKPLSELQMELFDQEKQQIEDYRRKLEEWQAIEKDHRGEKPEKPEPVRVYLTNDATIEAIGELLRDNPQGVLLARDEMDAWFQSLTRYKGGGGGTDRPHWLELHKAGTLILHRLTREQKRLSVRRAAVSLTGTIQPGILAAALDRESLQAGLGARFLLAMPPSRRRIWTEAEVSEELVRRYRCLLTDLLGLPLADVQKRRPYYLGLSHGAKEIWIDFYNQWGQVQFEAEGEQKSTFAKIEAYASRLMLLHHVIAEIAGGGPRVPQGRSPTLPPITEGSALAGIKLARWFAAEAVRIYAVLRESQEERDVRKLVEWITSQGGRVTVRLMQRSNSRKWPSSELAEEALGQLVEMGLGRWEEPLVRGGGGNPARWFVLLRSTHDTSDSCSGEGASGANGPSDTCSDSRSGDRQPGSGSNGASVFQGKACGGAFRETQEQVSEVSGVGQGRGTPDAAGDGKDQGEQVSGAPDEQVSDGHGDAWEG